MKHLALFFCLLAAGCSRQSTEKVVPGLTYEDLWRLSINDFYLKDATPEEALEKLGQKIRKELPGVSLNYVRPASFTPGEKEKRYTFRFEKNSLFETIDFLNNFISHGCIWKLERNTIVFSRLGSVGEGMQFFAFDYRVDSLDLGTRSNTKPFQDYSEPVGKLLKEINMHFKPSDYETAFFVPSRQLLFVHTTWRNEMLLQAVIDEKKDKH